MNELEKPEEIKELNELNEVGLLKDMLCTLPIHDLNKDDQSFIFKNWTMEEEKQISKLKNKEKNQGAFVTSVICHMLESLYGEDFKNKKTHEKIFTIGTMEIANILHLWICLRHENLGNLIQMPVICPMCNRMKENQIFSIDNMEIGVKNKNTKRSVIYELRKPFLFGEEKITKLKIGMSKWNIFSKLNNETSSNDGAMKEIMIAGSIIGINDDEGHIDGKSVTKNLSKYDIEQLQAVITENNGGPTMSIKGNCEFCGEEYYKTINWSYDSFFGVSSLPQKK